MCSYCPNRAGRYRFTAITIPLELALSPIAVVYDYCLAETSRHLVLSAPEPPFTWKQHISLSPSLCRSNHKYRLPPRRF